MSTLFQYLWGQGRMQQSYASAEAPKITYLASLWLYHAEESQMDWSVYAPLPELRRSILQLVPVLESPLQVTLRSCRWLLWEYTFAYNIYSIPQ